MTRATTAMKWLLPCLVLALAACESTPERKEKLAPRGHLTQQDVALPAGEESESVSPPAGEAMDADIPPVVQELPVLQPPQPSPEPQQLFTVVVTDVPADELLFALARDAKLNLDIHPDISGRVTINAIDQTLPQILARISQQVELRYRVDGPNLVVSPDTPYLQAYQVEYLNMSRESTSEVKVSTALASGARSEGGGGGGGGSSGTSGGESKTTLNNETANNFWESLERNVEQLLASSGPAGAGVVVSNRESGIIMVRATSRQHASVQALIDQVVNSARRQVLIEATIVEVDLNDRFQGGVDWSRIAAGAVGLIPGEGLTIEQAMSDGALSSAPFFAATIRDSNDSRDITATVRLLSEFGDAKVLSSPKVLALNNQPSVLKVVDNVVYFTIDVDTRTTQGVVTQTFTSNVNTVPVGFVMALTPFITDGDEVILNVRPSISRILGFKRDPNPALTVENLIPETTVRELESVLRVADGQIAIIGGLMQDVRQQDQQGIPGLSSVPGGDVLFGFKDRQTDKSELVVFLRPRIMETASLNGEQRGYRRFLPAAPGQY